MKAIYFSIVVIVFLLSFTFGLNVRAKELGIKLYDIGEAEYLPVLVGTKSYPTLSGQGIVAIDADSNVTLYEKNPDLKLYPASTTKIITALTALDYFKQDQVLVVINPTIEGQKMGLMVGERIIFENLLNALLIYSANDAAITIADNYPGGREVFVQAMNAKAKSLHLNNSTFTNPAGLDSDNQLTTARDMIRASEIAIQNPIFADIVRTKDKTISDVTGKFSYKFKNLNILLGTVEGVYGIKTGWTEAARENLITYVERDGRKVFIAILGSQDRFGETKELIDWVFNNYSWQKVTFTQKAVSSIF